LSDRAWAEGPGILDPVKYALLSAFAAVSALAGISWWALESSGVAIIETTKPDGTTRSTHVWHASHDGEIWLDSGRE
jgi:hypothetical protein